MHKCYFCFSSGIECLILSQPRWKKSQRCTLHSLEAGTARGWGGQATSAGAGATGGASAPCGWGWAAWGWGGRAAWRAAWDAMRASARDHVTLVHFNTLHDTLHNYLRKHRFCADCKTKVSFVTFCWLLSITFPLFVRCWETILFSSKLSVLMK